MEGRISNPDVVEHECGRHIYHISCLFDNRYADPRCAICRQPNISEINSHDTDDETTSNHSIPPTSPQPLQLNSLNITTSSEVHIEARPPFFQPYAIIPRYTRRCSFYRTICSHCRDDITPGTNHASILPCQHHIHDNCILNVILNHGITNTGALTCILCER